MFDPTSNAPFADLTLIGQLDEMTSDRAPNDKSESLYENQATFLPAEDVEKFLDSVNSPQNTLDQQYSPFFGRTTPLLYDEDGGASTDLIDSGAPITDTRGQTDSYPDFQQLGVVTNSGEEPQIEAVADVISLSDLSPGVVYPDDGEPVQPVSQGDKPALNEKLRRAIQKRRRKSGLEEIKPEWKQQEPEVLTSRDEIRLERRRESNRRAAAKSRIKKREENERNKQRMKQLIEENKMLKANLGEYMAIRQHLITCSNCHQLKKILSDAG